MVTKKELEELSKEELVKKCISYYTNYCSLRNKYMQSKADLILIKKQLSLIADNICHGSKGNKSGMAVHYYKGGSTVDRENQ